MIASQLRDKGVNTEVYPDEAKIKKQMSYAETKKIPFVALVGSEEMSKNIITIKDMNARDQFSCKPEELINKLRINSFTNWYKKENDLSRRDLSFTIKKWKRMISLKIFSWTDTKWQFIKFPRKNLR